MTGRKVADALESYARKMCEQRPIGKIIACYEATSSQSIGGINITFDAIH